jgi:hypothetical protein
MAGFGAVEHSADGWVGVLEPVVARLSLVRQIETTGGTKDRIDWLVRLQIRLLRFDAASDYLGKRPFWIVFGCFANKTRA